MTRQERVTEAVREVIHEWDPYGLLRGGAPRDEFDREIASVASQFRRIQSPEDAVDVLARVFSSAFERASFDIDQCREAGERLFAVLKERRLL